MSPKLSVIEKNDCKKESKNLLKNISSYNLLPEQSKDDIILDRNLSIEEINRLDSQ